MAVNRGESGLYICARVKRNVSLLKRSAENCCNRVTRFQSIMIISACDNGTADTMYVVFIVDIMAVITGAIRDFIPRDE